MKRLTVDIVTGEITEIDLTSKEIRDLNENYLSVRIEELRNYLISVRKSYLDSTDWYTAREIDQKGSYPEDVKENRILARQEINNIQDCNSIEQLDQFANRFDKLY